MPICHIDLARQPSHHRVEIKFPFSGSFLRCIKSPQSSWIKLYSSHIIPIEAPPKVAFIFVSTQWMDEWIGGRTVTKGRSNKKWKNRNVILPLCGWQPSSISDLFKSYRRWSGLMEAISCIWAMAEDLQALTVSVCLKQAHPFTHPLSSVPSSTLTKDPSAFRLISFPYSRIRNL